MRRAQVLFLLMLPGVAHATNGLDGAQRLTLHSKVLDEDRVMAVVTPASYGVGDERYPVLYLTDAEAQLGHARATVEFLARNELMPEVILVGILNTDRTRDLTPTRGTLAERLDSPTAGGGERFLDFIEKELLPVVEARYRTVPLRLYAGHSFGGLFGIHALFTRPGLFQAVVAASPSVEWDGEVLLREARSVPAKPPVVPRGLFVTLGGLEASPPVLVDFENFAKAVHQLPWPDFDWAWQLVPEEDHGSTVLLAYYAGLRHLFAGWRLPLKPEEKSIPSLAGVLAHYQRLSARWGYSVQPSESVVNFSAYVALQRKALGEALELFRYNVTAHPESANAQDSLGEALEGAGQLDLARASYRKAVEIAARGGSPMLLAPLQAHLQALDARLGTTSSAGH